MKSSYEVESELFSTTISLLSAASAKMMYLSSVRAGVSGRRRAALGGRRTLARACHLELVEHAQAFRRHCDSARLQARAGGGRAGAGLSE